MKGIEYHYRRGDSISSSEWKHDLSFFGGVVYPEVVQGKATGQFGFDKEIYWKKTKPEVILSPEQEYLLRPSNQKKLL